VLTVSPGPYAAGTPATVTQIEAMLGGSLDTSVTGPVPLTWSGLAASPTGVAATYPAPTASFAGGVATPSVVHAGQRVATTLTATDAASTSVTGSSASTVAPGAAAALAVTTQPGGALGGRPSALSPCSTCRTRSATSSPPTPRRQRSRLARDADERRPGALSGCGESETLGVIRFHGCTITTRVELPADRVRRRARRRDDRDVQRDGRSAVQLRS